MANSMVGRLLRSPLIGSLSTRIPTTTRTACPAFHPPAFSTSTPRCKKTRDRSRNRGVSSLYRSGPRQKLSVSDEEIPKPSDYTPRITVDKNHGLWEFFPRPYTLMNTPEEEAKHGRAWTVEELRQKSWKDLHALWWVCVKERNRLATAARERSRAKMGFGDAEGDERDAEVRKTMQRIKHALTERFYAWEDACELAKNDSEFELNDEGVPVYRRKGTLLSGPMEESGIYEEDPIEGSKLAKEEATSEQAAVEPESDVEHTSRKTPGS